MTSHRKIMECTNLENIRSWVCVTFKFAKCVSSMKLFVRHDKAELIGDE